MKNFDIIEKVNEDMRRKHITQCRKCKYICSNDFCTVFQKNILYTSFECDGSDEVISTIV